MTDISGAGGKALARYVTAATLARSADGGAVVGVVILVTSLGGEPWVAGLLGACITFPHLAGPFTARTLDVAKDGRTVLAVACIAHGATLAGAVMLYGQTWVAVPALLLVVSGAFGPLLTGGISSRLPEIAGADRGAQRRAQGWDVATYGLGGTIGPTLVAAISSWWSAQAAVLILAGAAASAAILVRLLPPGQPAPAGRPVPRPWRTFHIMVTSGPLRRTLYATVAVALAVAVLPVVAVAGAHRFGFDPAAAGFLTAAYGLGSLAGSMIVMIRPLRGDADSALPVLAGAVGVALGAVLIVPGFAWAIAAYALAGILNSFFFAATLAARSEYAPLEARGQVFVWVGALKISAGSAGTAAAGALVGAGPNVSVAAAASVAVVAAITAWIDRSFSGRLGGDQ